MKDEGYYIEWDGEQWQSVFPSHNIEFSQLHDSIQDAYEYIQKLVGNVPVIIKRED